MRRFKFSEPFVTLSLSLGFWFAPSASADLAPEPAVRGPLPTTSAEYQFPASLDPDILGDRETEIWARVYRPADLSTVQHPVILMLHGNHSTCGTGSNPRVDDSCQYTTTGTCPDGYVMVPSYMGFGYLAEQLASWGYVVVSINANRGINCGDGVPGDAGLITARGNLVLKHLQLLSQWNTSGGTPSSLGVELMGTLDFSNVGLMGHSRGGQGVRAAYNSYRDASSPWPASIPDPVTFKGIVEWAPSEIATSQATGQALNAIGTNWSVLLPMCDGDLSSLPGVRPFDRMMHTLSETPPSLKATYVVWGANHNFFNTEWQQSDSTGCTDHSPLWSTGDIGSALQQQAGLLDAMGLIRGSVGAGADSRFNQTFDPMYDLPLSVSSLTIERGFSPASDSSLTTVVDDFHMLTGTNSHGVPNSWGGLPDYFHGTVPNHDPSQRAARISWNASGQFFQDNWTAAGSGRDVTGYQALDFRISRQANFMLNPDVTVPSNFHIQLVDKEDNVTTAVALSDYLQLVGPVGGPGGLRHPILQTVRIPLSAFQGGYADLTQIRGVRYTFDDTQTGAIYLGDIRFSAVPTPPRGGCGGSAAPARSWGTPPLAASPAVYSGTMALQSPPSSGAGTRSPSSGAAMTSAQTASFEIVLHSARGFAVGDQLPTLHVGDTELTVSRFGPGGDTTTLIFTASGTLSGDVVLENAGETYTFGSM